MIFDRKTIELLEEFAGAPWSGNAFRHMFAEIPPDRENTRGARWNPPETRAIYTSLERETVLAEANHAMAMQPVMPSTRRTIYSIEIVLEDVLDLSDWAILERLSLDRDKIMANDFTPCQAVGGAVDWLGHDGLLIPSARTTGTNLVVFPNQARHTYDFRVVDSEVL